MPIPNGLRRRTTRPNDGHRHRGNSAEPGTWGVLASSKLARRAAWVTPRSGVIEDTLAGRRYARQVIDDGRKLFRRANGFLFTLAVLPLLVAACSSSTATSAATTMTVSIPAGWKSYTYGKMAIAVPGSWLAKHNTNCPNSPAPGTLLLGLPPILSFCAAFQYPNSVVTVQQLGVEPKSTFGFSNAEKPRSINGIPVYLGFGSPTMIQWIVPSLGVEITGTGPDSNRVLHTLHKG